jgi:hypothetical protein
MKRPQGDRPQNDPRNIGCLGMVRGAGSKGGKKYGC